MLAAAVALAGAAAARAGEPVNVNWPSYLPALPGPNRPQPHAVPHCRTATVRCIDVEIQRLRALQRRLGCAHRAVFTTTYLELTRTLRQTLRKQPNFFRYPRYLYIEDALFGQVNAGQDMLLGINAHVQNDMPFVLAALGQRTRSGAS